MKDAETVPTIKRLVAYVRRKFEKEPEFCRDERKFGLFVERIQDSLTGSVSYTHLTLPTILLV